ncbi:replication initiation protein [Helicobacter cetorum]|uniref:replication initiation protein n=1 Tax=Helicobacter cetorum TaxID=138563 RepID=UPI0012DE7D51|nr:replication initiation protein [Helicobacter cetorum]
MNLKKKKIPTKTRTHTNQRTTRTTNPTRARATQKKAILAKDLKVVRPNDVTIHNDIYKVYLGKLGALESNLFYSIFDKLKEQDDTLVRFNPSEIKAMIGNSKISGKELTKVVKKLWNNIKFANFWILLPRRDENHMLFRTFAINYYDDKKTQIKDIEVQVNKPHYTYLLNDLTGNFTQFELEQFKNLSSKYAKTLFRMLKQFDDIENENNHCELLRFNNNFDEFMEFMGIDKNMEMRDIERQILKPICKELGAFIDKKEKAPLIIDLKKPYATIEYKKIHGKYNKVIGIEFYYTKHEPKTNEHNRIETTLRTQEIKKTKQEKVKGFYKQNEIKSLENHYLNKTISFKFNNPKDGEIKEVLVTKIETFKDNEKIRFHFDNTSSYTFTNRQTLIKHVEILSEKLF